MIPLDVVVIPAASERPASDPVFFLAGGPGRAATESWAHAPQVFPAIHQDRDIVHVDQVVLTSDSLAGSLHDLLVTGQSGEIPRLLHLMAEAGYEPLTASCSLRCTSPIPASWRCFWSIECSERWAAHDRDDIAEVGAGSYYLPVMLDADRDLDLGCSLMPRVPTPADEGRPVRSDVSILLLNGTLDPQDPPANVADAATELPNSLVIVATQSHTFGHIGCMPDVVAAFIEAGTPEGLGTTCVGELPTPRFSTSGV